MKVRILGTLAALAFIIMAVMSACAVVDADLGGATYEDAAHEHEAHVDELVAAELADGEKLRVVATTGIVADVVANVGGDAIELTSLMPVGADPHSYTATPEDLRTLNDAHVIFINGLNLEGSLMPILENLDAPVPIVSVSEGVETIAFGEPDKESAATEEAHEHEEADEHGHEHEEADEHGHEHEEADEHAHEHEHGNADPHTWFSVANVQKWADNIEGALSALDPSGVDQYRTAAQEYGEELSALDAEIRALIESVPVDNRRLVTDHIALGYFARDYGFETLGAVLPSFSTLAAASAQELAALQQTITDAGVKALFVSTSVNPQTSNQLAKDLGIPVVMVYTGSLSKADGPAPTYVDLMRYDVSQIVEALR